MTKNISSFLPSLSITRLYYPKENQNTICKIIKLAAYLLALPFLILADLLYAAFYARSPESIQIAEEPLPPPPPLPKPDPLEELDYLEPEPIELPPPEPILTPDPISELPSDMPEPLNEEPVVSTIPQSQDPIAPLPQEASLFSRVAPVALGLLGLGTLAYFYRSYGHGSLPPSETLNNQQEEKEPTENSLKPINFSPCSFGQSPIGTCDANFNISTYHSFPNPSPFAHSSPEIDPAPISNHYAPLSFLQSFSQQQTPLPTPFAPSSSGHGSLPSSETLNNQQKEELTENSLNPTHSYPFSFDRQRFSLGQSLIRNCDANFNISTCQSLSKPSPFAHSSLEIDPMPIALLYPPTSFDRQPFSRQQDETSHLHCEPQTLNTLLFGQCPINSSEPAFSQNLTILESQINDPSPSLAPPLPQDPTNDSEFHTTASPPPAPNPPQSLTPDLLWGLGSFAFTGVGLALWNLVRGGGANPAPPAPQGHQLPPMRLNQNPLVSDPSPPNDQIDYIPQDQNLNQHENEINLRKEVQPLSVQSKFPALAKLKLEDNGLISIPLNVGDIYKLFLGPNDLRHILSAFNQNDFKVLNSPFPCEIEKVDEYGSPSRISRCEITPLEFLQSLKQSKGLESEFAASSKALPDHEMNDGANEWLEYLKTVTDPFCRFELNEDQDFSSMYVRTEKLIEALDQNTDFSCFLEPRNPDQLSQKAEKLRWIHSQNLGKEVAVAEYSLLGFLSLFPPPKPPPGASSQIPTNTIPKERELLSPREEKYLQVLSLVQKGKNVFEACQDASISTVTFHRLSNSFIEKNHSPDPHEASQSASMSAEPNEIRAEAWIRYLNENSKKKEYWFPALKGDAAHLGIYIQGEDLLRALSSSSHEVPCLYSTKDLQEYIDGTINLSYFLKKYPIPQQPTLKPALRQRHENSNKQNASGLAEELKDPQKRVFFGEDIIPEILPIGKSSQGFKPSKEQKRSGFNPFSSSRREQPIALKERLQQLKDKTFRLPDVRTQIINGRGKQVHNKSEEGARSQPVVLIWEGGFRNLPDDLQQSSDVQSLSWNLEKLLHELEMSLPFISCEGKRFDSVEELLNFFGTFSNNLESAPEELISTLCCLTREATQICRREFHFCVNQEKPHYAIGDDSEPQIRIEVGEDGSTTIQISQDYLVRDKPVRHEEWIEEPVFEMTAILSLKGKHNDTLRIEHRPRQRTDREKVSYIGEGSANFVSDALPALNSLPSRIESLDTLKEPLTWSEFTYAMLPSYNDCQNYYSNCQNWIVHALTHRPGPVHDHKYHIALNVLIDSLKTWIATHVVYNNGLEDFWANLQAAYEGTSLHAPYEEIFNDDYKNSPFVKKVIDALDGLLEPDSIRKRSRDYLSALRDALQMTEYQDNPAPFKHLNSLLRELCWARFTRNRMQKYEEEFLRLATQGTFTDLRCSTIANAIGQGNEKLANCSRELRKAPQDSAWQKFRNSTGILADPLGESNVPEIRSIYMVQQGEERYPVLCLRHGTPTYQPPGSWKEVFLTPETVVPEYRCFLDSAKEKKIHVLYVNHQKMYQGSSWYGLGSLLSVETNEENNRSLAIQALETDNDHFHFLSLPYDGKIWSKEFLGIKKTSEWKESLANALVKGEHGLQLPKDCRLSKEKLLTVADAIHCLYFRKKTDQTPDGRFILRDLTFDERKLFLMIFYSYVKELIMAEYNISIIASPCKDDKDRGNASKGVDEAIRNLRSGLEDDEGALHRLYVRTLAPFIIKYEEIIDHRLQPLLHLLNHIATLSDSEKRAIQKYRPAHNYSIKQIEDEERFYPIHTDIQSATSLKETQFDSFTTFVKTACQKAGTVNIPNAQANLLYKSSSPELNDSFRNPDSSWNLENLKASLQRMCVLNTRSCNSTEDLENALGIEKGALYHPRDHEFHYRLGRLASLTQKAVTICDEGLTEFLKKNSPFPMDSIKFKRISLPLFTSRSDKPPYWTNIIAQDYYLYCNGEQIRVCVRAETNSYKETTVTIYPVRNDIPSAEAQ